MPLITPTIEPGLYQYLAHRAAALGGFVHAVGGTENHIHVVASIPPGLSVGQFLKYLKGGSSHYITHGGGAPAGSFRWQEGYGIFSVGPRQLPRAIAYVQQQKAHHAAGTLITALEQDQPPSKPNRRPPGTAPTSSPAQSAPRTSSPQPGLQLRAPLPLTPAALPLTRAGPHPPHSFPLPPPQYELPPGPLRWLSYDVSQIITITAPAAPTPHRRLAVAPSSLLMAAVSPPSPFRTHLPLFLMNFSPT